MEIHWLIEEWIPAEIAISRKGYWAALKDSRFKDEAEARTIFKRLESDKAHSVRYNVRLIKETREVKG